MNARSSRAFTLIELLIVVAIIGVLIALLIPAFGGFRNKSLQSHCRNNLKTIYSVLRTYAQNNDGMYPVLDVKYGINHWYGTSFVVEYYNEQSGLNVDYNVDLKPLNDMKSYGASRRTFFCPFHRDYDRDTGRPTTWDKPRLSTAGSGIKTATVEFGYTFFINRGATYGKSPYADGRPTVRSNVHADNLPLVADDLHYRLITNLPRPESWFHGGGRYDQDPDSPAVFNSDCNTLLGNGTVVWKDWAYLEDQGPGLVNPDGDQYWFYQGYEGKTE